MSKLKLEELKYVGMDAQDNSVEEVVPATEPVENNTKEVETPVENIEIDNVAADPVEEATEEVTEEPVEEVVEEPAEIAAKENITAAVVDKPTSSIQFVTNIRIYSKPSTLVPARNFTGNVEIIGRVDEFTIVKYVRAGFGAIKGYTKDI